MNKMTIITNQNKCVYHLTATSPKFERLALNYYRTKLHSENIDYILHMERVYNTVYDIKITTRFSIDNGIYTVYTTLVKED